MKVIGLTGGVASGKSQAACILESLGASVIDTDTIARDVVAIPNVQDELKREWPDAFEGESLSRKKLRKIVFASREAREKLNRILHPLIIKKTLEEVEREKAKISIIVAPLLIEAGLHQMVDEIWVVKVPKELQIKRLMERDHLEKEDALAMIESQLPIEEKSALAHRVFENADSPDALRAQLEKAWNELIKRA